ncbi:zinc-finger domain-containing protein [Thioclava sp. GXIMD4216]|uniref:Zinc-finger domain-containing protein n=1 Tax=Thioclava litoralis TaxID=3076557 RepID=A0ABZ1DXP4_9RHOB|nr:zinc-finger domain-containing protein [Thioclava sp. FTW29]
MTATTQTAATPTPSVPEAPETEIVTTWKVCCDGGVGALGHPRVWLAIPPETGFVECGYCDKKYVIDRAHAKTGH